MIEPIYESALISDAITFKAFLQIVCAIDFAFASRNLEIFRFKDLFHLKVTHTLHHRNFES